MSDIEKAVILFAVAVAALLALVVMWRQYHTPHPADCEWCAREDAEDAR